MICLSENSAMALGIIPLIVGLLLGWLLLDRPKSKKEMNEDE